MSTQIQNQKRTTSNRAPSPSLAGKVAVVTGASKGIGAATARRLAAAGAAVVVNYSTSKADADKVVAEITAQGGRAVAVQGDVSKRVDATSIIDAAVEHFGRLDILVNNSGIYKLLPLADLKEEDFHRHFNVNVLGVLLTTQAALKHLPEGGSVINISSGVTTIVPANSAVYTGTKGAVDAITGVLSRELGPRQIRVNSVNPGFIQTEGTATAGFVGSDFEKWAVSNTPLGRVGQPDDIADVVVFLASDASAGSPANNSSPPAACGDPYRNPLDRDVRKGRPGSPFHRSGSRQKAANVCRDFPVAAMPPPSKSKSAGTPASRFPTRSPGFPEYDSGNPFR